MKRMTTRQKGFPALYRALHARGDLDFQAVEESVARIIADVRRRGDRALVDLAARFDGARLTPAGLRVGAAEVRAARRRVPRGVLDLLGEAIGRIRDFHRLQGRRSWFVTGSDGSIMGQSFAPMDSAGLYVPGGKAVYPSTMLMNAIPAQVAGVERLVVCTPAPGGKVHPLVLAAADLLGIDEIYKVGGAQAVAALAYGTRAIAPVDKIVGPGNIYVAAAKKAVWGRVSIDMIAGPSEIFIIADGSADPPAVAADLLSQAEHDQMATALLLTDSPALADAVEKEVRSQLGALPRRAIAAASLGERGWIILTRDLDEAFDLAGRLAPEHLEVLVKDPLARLPQVRHVGSAFFGPWTPEALGDYLAGPNHVLPTGGAARFSSTLGVEDFLVRSNILFFGRRGFEKLAPGVARLATLEGLDAHARSVGKRLAARRR